MSWLPWPILPKKRWPAIEYGPKQAITRMEHTAIVERKRNSEWKALYALLWHVGGGQTDVATRHYPAIGIMSNLQSPGSCLFIYARL